MPAATSSFGYCDWNGKLSVVTNASGFMVEYENDVMDRVTNISWKTTSGATLGGFEYEYDAAGRIVSRAHTLGDPSQMSQSSQKSYAYDDLDRLAFDDGVTYTYRYRFQCREWSAATGLVNFRMRWYDAETGRWLSKDPIGLSGGLNLYAFCGNDAMCRTDPSGLSGLPVIMPIFVVDPEDANALLS